MPKSLIRNIDRHTGRLISAAPDEGVLRTSADLGWRGIAVELHRIAPDHQPEHYVRTHRLMIHTGRPTRFEWREAGGRWHATTLQADDVTLLSDGVLNEPRWHDPLEFLAVGIDPAFVAQAFGDALSSDTGGLDPVRGRADPVIARFGALFARELADPQYTGSLFGETVALAFARHLLTAYGSRHPGEPRGALSGRQLERVLAYLHGNLSEDVSLAALAGEAAVSPFHFVRLFRAAVGLPPHRFVMELRIAHAKRLLRAARYTSLTEVGAAAGFFDQAHFTRTFKRFVGVAPTRFARA